MMFKNYLNIAFRNLWRQKFYSMVNIFGLAVGIACCGLIVLFVLHERSYDDFHENADSIYRVLVGEQQVVTPTIVAPLARRELPEVVQSARLFDAGAWTPVIVRREDESFYEHRFFFADASVFDVFSFEFLAETPDDALMRPRTLVLTESTARKYFGSENPIGRSLMIGTATAYEITAVIRDLPSNSHLEFDFLGSFNSLQASETEQWYPANYLTYVLAQPGVPQAALARSFNDLVDRHRVEGMANDYFLSLQPLRSVHLQEAGRITYLYLFASIAALVLLVACINYMNLATARSIRRAREVGIRRTSGAQRGQLVGQFYLESGLTTVFAVLLSIGLMELFLPFFGQLAGVDLNIPYAQISTMAAFVGVAGMVTLVAGSYPALVLSSFRPVRVLKGTVTGTLRGAFTRKVLVTFQFAISVFLIIGTAVVSNQLRYIQTKNLGFDKEQVLVLPLSGGALSDSYEAFKSDVLQHPQVLSVSGVGSVPGYQRGGYGLIAEGLALQPGEFFAVQGVQADRDIVETLNMELIVGPGFPASEAYSLDDGYRYIANETLVRSLGWDPELSIGKRMGLSEGRMGTLVGVVRDFHYESLHQPIQPLAFFIEPSTYYYLLARVSPTDVRGAIGVLEASWTSFAPGMPFDFRFLDSEIEALYRSEERMASIFTVFAFLAILIACMGLIGLAAFSAEQRTKEIGVRKVMGASVASIIALLSKDFARLILFATLIAAPIGYLAMERWLQDFAYRISIDWWIFALAGGIALVIAMITVASQAVKAAVRNPVESLRYE